jgi:hypothetical protein
MIDGNRLLFILRVSDCAFKKKTHFGSFEAWEVRYSKENNGGLKWQMEKR